MIIQGQVLTANGPVDIKNLKPGDKVLNQLHRAFAVTAVQKKTVSVAYAFTKNPNLMVTKETIIKTVYGSKKVEKTENVFFYMAQPNARMIKDKAQKVLDEYIAYDIQAEGCNSIFVSNYCLELEDKNA